MDCRFCQHYHFEGHRHGHCQAMGVSVEGRLSMCRLGHLPFVKQRELPVRMVQHIPELILELELLYLLG